MKRVVIYCRVSTEEEHQLNALERQIEELTDFVNEKEEWLLVDKYVDRGKSGTTTAGRYQYNKLYADMLTDKFDVICVKDNSRLARNSLDWLLFRDRLIKQGKQLYLYLKGEYFTMRDALMNDIEAAIAAQYSRELSTKILHAAKKAQEQGTIYGNSLMYGYRKDKGKLIVDEQEAEVVRLIFDLYLQGNGFRKIQNILMERGIYSNTGTPFSMSTMKRMIRNEKYKGVIVSHKTYSDFDKKTTTPLPESEWVKIYDPLACPPIVSADVFDKAVAMLESRRQENGAEEAKKRGAFQGNVYPLSGKLMCANCGKTYWHEHYITTTNHLERNIWQCATYKAHGAKACKNRNLRDDILMPMIREVLFELIGNDDVKAVLDMIEQEDNTEKRDYAKDIRLLESKIQRLEKRKENLTLNLADGIINREDYQKAKQQTIDDISRVMADIADLRKQQEGTNSDKFKAIRDFLNASFQGPDDITDDVIKDIVDKIAVNDVILDVYIKTGMRKELLYSIPKNKCASVSDTGQQRPHTHILYKTRKRRIKRKDSGTFLYFVVHI